MARIVVSEFISIDGVIEAPGGEAGYAHAGWVMRYPDAEQFQYKLDEVLAHEGLLLGRRTYEGFAAAWPSRDGVFADKMNGMPKYVASTTLQSLAWSNSSLLVGDAMAAVAGLKATVTGDLLVAGSRTLVNALKRADLVDEYRLMVFPIVLGSGMRLFDEVPEPASLALASARTFGNGAVVLTYHRNR